MNSATKKFNLCLKRVFDILLSLFGMVISLPLWVIIPLAIYLEDGRPIFFIDERLGREKRPYKHFKFRSMVRYAENETGPVWATKKDARVTRIGSILRATAMDEIPQLVNILKGEMSFVGPRPERPRLVKEFQEKIPSYDKRFAVKAGLTGMAQVYGKYDTPPEKKLRYDLEYIDKMNLFLDLKLIISSIFITLSAGWARFEKKS